MLTNKTQYKTPTINILTLYLSDVLSASGDAFETDINFTTTW